MRIRRDAFDGEILGESRAVTIDSQHDGMVHFDFDDPVTLSPGERHVIEVVRAGGPGQPLLGAGDYDAYPNGRRFWSGTVVSPTDIWFRTGLGNITPVRPTTWGELKTRYR